MGCSRSGSRYLFSNKLGPQKHKRYGRFKPKFLRNKYVDSLGYGERIFEPAELTRGSFPGVHRKGQEVEYGMRVTSDSLLFVSSSGGY